MTVSLLRADDADKQRAFLSLLARPVVTLAHDPATYALVHRHARVLGQWCRRLDYRLAHLDQCYRLRRTPIDETTAVPVGPRPTRGRLLLSLYAAACLDDHRADSITLQELSDIVHLSAAGRGGWPYDPNMHQHRKLFVGAVTWLVEHGVLQAITDDVLREGWERTGAGIGAGYRIHRDALVLLIDTGDIELALHPPQHTDDDTRGTRLLRRLVETQALYPEELTDDERTYLTGQRNRLVSLAEEMTGGIVEVRADALVLSIAPDRDLPPSIILDFPGANAVDWAALAVIDRIAATTTGSFRRIHADDVRAIAADIHATAGDRLTADLRASADAIVGAVRIQLCALGLLRVRGDEWTLTPLAGRYRDADLGADEPAPAPTVEQTSLWEDA